MDAAQCGTDLAKGGNKSLRMAATKQGDLRSQIYLHPFLRCGGRNVRWRETLINA